jgi:hypothetical protein
MEFGYRIIATAASDLALRTKAYPGNQKHITPTTGVQVAGVTQNYL